MEELIEFIKKYLPNTNYVIKDETLVILDDGLDLSNNKLTSLPDSFGNIKVNYLYLSNNKLTSLPDSFGNLKVNILYLTYNKLTSLPDSFGNLKVNYLYLYNNKLTSLPDSFGNIKVNILYLSYNKLTSLPDTFGNIKVNYLNLSDNKLTSQPKFNKFDDLTIGEDYIFCDNILMEFHSIKHINDVTYYIGYHSVVALKDGVTSHGNTLKDSYNDLMFKLSEKDIEKYKSYDKNKKLSYDECIILYRLITGSCKFGVNQFIVERKIKKGNSFSINEIIEITKGEYGNNKLVEFFN